MKRYIVITMKYKVFTLLLFVLILFNSGFSSTSACSLNRHASTWHCSNNSPGISLKPGEKGNITIYCCYTSPYASVDDEYSLVVQKVENYSRMVQQPDGSWVKENTYYAATPFISNIYYNRTVGPNQDIPITIEFTMPQKSDYYEPGKVLHARTDVMLNAGGSFIMNNIIDTRVVIPDDWKPSILTQLIILVKNNPIVLGSATLILIVIALTFYLIGKV